MDNVLSFLEDTAEAALDLLDHAMLSAAGQQRLLDSVAANQEARGHRATEEEIATLLFEQMKTAFRKAIESFRDAVEPSRVAEAVARLQEFRAVAVPLLESASFEPLGRELVKFSFVRNTLSRPIPPPSPEDEARRVLVAGWNSLEVGFLASDLRDGDIPLTSLDASHVTTKTGRVISRHELRERYRPVSWTRIDSWYAQFPAIQEDTK